MPSELIASLTMTPLAWLLAFMLWFAIGGPLIALLEYGTHRWIMHVANRLLDPQLHHLKSHAAHHKGENTPEFVDVPLKRRTTEELSLANKPGLSLAGLVGARYRPLVGGHSSRSGAVDVELFLQVSVGPYASGDSRRRVELVSALWPGVPVFSQPPFEAPCQWPSELRNRLSVD